MTRDLIAEVAESCAGAWYPPGPDCNLLRDSIDAVLRERFEVVETNFHTGKDDGRVCTRDGWYRRYKGEDHNVQIILVPRPVAPKPTVAEAARAFVDWWDNDRAGYAPLNALRAALAEEAKR